VSVLSRSYLGLCLRLWPHDQGNRDGDASTAHATDSTDEKDDRGCHAPLPGSALRSYWEMSPLTDSITDLRAPRIYAIPSTMWAARS
jgi:hypothetical protein